jgi:oligopeptidase B
VAKLRDYKTDQNLLLFKTELEQGHKGAIGRYDRIKEYAFYYAFIEYCYSI